LSREPRDFAVPEQAHNKIKRKTDFVLEASRLNAAPFRKKVPTF